MLCEFPDKSKGCLMSIETRTVGAVTQTSETELAADQQHSFANVLLRFKAAPTVAHTSVSRQTGLSGIWNQSSDPASQTSILHSGMTNQMKNNTLVVRPKNRFYRLRATVRGRARSNICSTTTSPRCVYDYF
jgi:hypothetical protein